MQLIGVSVVSYRDVWGGNGQNLRSEKSGNKAICSDNRMGTVLKKVSPYAFFTTVDTFQD